MTPVAYALYKEMRGTRVASRSAGKKDELIDLSQDLANKSGQAFAIATVFSDGGEIHHCWIYPQEPRPCR